MIAVFESLVKVILVLAEDEGIPAPNHLKLSTEPGVSRNPLEFTCAGVVVEASSVEVYFEINRVWDVF